MIAATVLIIAKEPRPGHAKTRLSPPCSPDEAATIATAALHDTFCTFARVPVQRRVAVLDGRPGTWLPRSFEVVPQCDGPLGARLAHAYAGTDGPALLVGMDTPQVTPALIVNALRKLLTDGVDAVLGCAPDGGWWAIGLRRADTRAFAGVPMSSAETGARQLERLQELGLRTELLPELRDVDNWSDARAVAAGMSSRTQFASAVNMIAHAIEGRTLSETA